MKTMKKLLILITVSLATVFAASGQRLAIGEKAPSMRVKEWLSPSAPAEGKAQLIEFFHSSNKQCATRLGVLEDVAEKYSGKLNVIVIAKEPVEKVTPILDPASAAYYTALDEDGRTFADYGAQFVPFSVLVDKKGRIVWFGNPSSLDEKTISSAL